MFFFILYGFTGFALIIYWLTGIISLIYKHAQLYYSKNNSNEYNMHKPACGFYFFHLFNRFVFHLIEISVLVFKLLIKKQHLTIKYAITIYVNLIGVQGVISHISQDLLQIKLILFRIYNVSDNLLVANSWLLRFLPFFSIFTIHPEILVSLYDPIVLLLIKYLSSALHTISSIVILIHHFVVFISYFLDARHLDWIIAELFQMNYQLCYVISFNCFWHLRYCYQSNKYIFQQ